MAVEMLVNLSGSLQSLEVVAPTTLGSGKVDESVSQPGVHSLGWYACHGFSQPRPGRFLSLRQWSLLTVPLGRYGLNTNRDQNDLWSSSSCCKEVPEARGL